MLEIDHDLHVHTYLSACCGDPDNQRPAKILARAEELGLRTIGFADHLWVNPDLEPSNWYRPQDESQIARLRADLAVVSTSTRVLVGCESETIAPGKFGITREMAEQLDFVLLPCNHLHMLGFVEQPASGRPRDVAEHLLRLFRSAVESGLATAIPHPFTAPGFMDRFDALVASVSDAEFLDVCGLAAERGVALEITRGFVPPAPGPDRPSWSLETPLRFLGLARQAGCKFTFGSDAHCFADVGSVADIRPIVDALDLTRDDVAPVARGASAQETDAHPAEPRPS